MIDSSDDIDFKLSNIWRSWYRFRAGKRRSDAIDRFEYYLESNLMSIQKDLVSGSYVPGPLKQRLVLDKKPRLISVSPVRDRMVQRLVYDYLVPIVDPGLSPNVYSCRPGRGLQKAWVATSELLKKYRYGWVWRADVAQFFASIRHDLLLRQVDAIAIGDRSRCLVETIIAGRQSCIGLPIGSLTSQILANVYLNVLDKFVEETIWPLGYIRYGDDIVVFTLSLEVAEDLRSRTREFLFRELGLSLHIKNDIVCRCSSGVKYLGCWLYPTGSRMINRDRVWQRVNEGNVASYGALVGAAEPPRIAVRLKWQTMNASDG